MRSHYPIARRICAAIVACVSLIAHGQPDSGPNSVPNAAPGATDPNHSAAASQPYQDRVIDGLAPRIELDIDAPEYNTQGWPRGIALQLTRNLQSTQNVPTASGNARTDTQGVQVDAFIDTPNHGALSLHALALGGSRTTGLTSWSLRQTGLPFDGGWRADNALGTTNLLVPELARRSSRLTLPGTQILGGSTVWRNVGENRLVFGASVGEPGRFEGFPQSRFVRLGGQVQSLIGQAGTRDWTAAAAVAQGSDILPEVAPFSTDGQTSALPRISPRGYYLSIAQDEPVAGANLQANLIGSRSGGAEATGIWADATWRGDGHRHQGSVFRFAEGLNWIDRPLPADLQGASYRYDYHSLRWDLSANLESFTSVSARGGSGWFASSSGRRMLSAQVSTGAGFAFRDFGARSASAFGYIQWLNALGASRLQLDGASTQGGERSQAATIDQSLYAENGDSLSTSLTLERILRTAAIDATRTRERAASLGLNGRTQLSNRFSLQGSVRVRNVSGDGANRGTSLAANLGLDWQINRDWSLGGSLYANRGVVTELIPVQSPLVIPEVIRARPSDRGFFLTLRYSLSAGSPSFLLGGPPGSGAGRIEGTVFLDSNGNGRRDASETGAANVMVVLDGKFSTRTNAFGDFEFANVVSGPHALSVLQDDLPLPWIVDTAQKVNASVSTRSTTRVEIGAKRMP